TSLRSELSGPLLLVKAANAALCINEPPPSERHRLVRAGGAVKAPIARTRVEPAFPDNARRSMPMDSNVLVMVESVISRDGCIRSMRLLRQSPFPDLNGAALLALSRWTFVPGYVDGKPADVIFTLTVNFRLH